MINFVFFLFCDTFFVEFVQIMCYYPFRIHKNLFIIVDLGRVPYDYGNNFLYLKCLTKKECAGMLWDSVSIKMPV